MKRLFIILCASVLCAQAQVQKDSVRTIATTTWSKISYTTQTPMSGYIVNEGVNLSDSIAFCAGVIADTAQTNRHKLYGGEVAYFTNKPIKEFWFKSLSNSSVNVRICIANSPINIVKFAERPVPITNEQITLIPLAPAQTIVDTISAQAIAANTSRKSLIISNLSDFKVSLGLGATAIKDKGIVLYPGEKWNMNNHSYCTVAIYAIAESTNCVISIQEFQ